MKIKKIGIRKEDKNKWEKRTPIVPQDALSLIEEHQIVLSVEPSVQRVFSDTDYRAVGASIQDTPDAPFILGVKEIPVSVFEPNKTYLFFSHTIKGQPYNMPLLKKMMALGDTLIDYEMIKDENNRRLIAFGRYAGIAGMIDTLWALGKRFEVLGYDTPFKKVKRATGYEDIAAFNEQVKEISCDIKENGLPEIISPCIIGIAGYGNVSKGAQEILDRLPILEVSPAEVSHLPFNTKQLFKVVFKEEDLCRPKEGDIFDLQEYYRSPERYQSVFTRYMPYLTVLINAIYWEERYPRLITKEWLKKNHDAVKPYLTIGDISCDIDGAIECTVKSTNPDEPVYVYDPLTEKISMGYEGKGVLIGAVDILPTEFPKESSLYFSRILKDYIVDIVNADYPNDFKNCTLPPHLKRAVILYKGKLTENYQYLNEYL